MLHLFVGLSRFLPNSGVSGQFLTADICSEATLDNREVISDT